MRTRQPTACAYRSIVVSEGRAQVPRSSREAALGVVHINAATSACVNLLRRRSGDHRGDEVLQDLIVVETARLALSARDCVERSPQCFLPVRHGDDSLGASSGDLLANLRRLRKDAKSSQKC
jgi:hypothetical protein